MPEYRLHVIGPDEHYTSTQKFECVDDDEAIARTSNAVTAYGAELYELDRLIATIAPAAPQK